MNSITTSTAIKQQIVQQNQRTQQSSATEATNKSSESSEITRLSGMIRQDTSDVTRMGTSGRLRVRDEKVKEKESLTRVRNTMSPEKTEKAEKVETNSLGNFAKRRRSSIRDEDKDYARREVEDLLKELEREFSNTETASILFSLKENPVVQNDAVLKEQLEDVITDMIQHSLTTKMEISSYGILPQDNIMNATQARDVRENVILGYSTQEEFLCSLEAKLGMDKMNNDFPAVLSHCMLELSASMGALATAGGGEKGSIYAAMCGIASLQQLSGVFLESSKILLRMQG